LKRWFLYAALPAIPLGRRRIVPFDRRKWKRSSAMTNEDRLRVNLVPVFSERTPGSFSRDEIQGLLDEKAASGLPYSVVAHLGWDMRQIFRMAAAEGYLLPIPPNCFSS
jgi:hypothetical protein